MDLPSSSDGLSSTDFYMLILMVLLILLYYLKEIAEQTRSKCEEADAINREVRELLDNPTRRIEELEAKILARESTSGWPTPSST
ncbi:hypothetical protein MKW98_020763 [Papaver atlanticum]|uniref:Uncharacterized protein n=1 Tax=Papaver atlanticum TaxID=357466 RepID=A0AAD4TIP7_9MAGN|nr:hypothetical protein MKW98_020763 [Papaver atlanticum]